MPYGAFDASQPPPRPNVMLARGCEVCHGWGTVVTDRGCHELCPACQSRACQVERAV